MENWRKQTLSSKHVHKVLGVLLGKRNIREDIECKVRGPRDSTQLRAGHELPWHWAAEAPFLNHLLSLPLLSPKTHGSAARIPKFSLFSFFFLFSPSSFHLFMHSSIHPKRTQCLLKMLPLLCPPPLWVLASLLQSSSQQSSDRNNTWGEKKEETLNRGKVEKT